jgi:3-dehydroquinate synthetase
MRGINNVVYIPTTLLAIVDATVGGKTGINMG